MKTAIVCDWLVTLGGAEKVIGELIQCFPEADVFAVVDFIPVEQRGFLMNKPVKTTWIQQLPFAKKHYRHYLPLMPFAIEQLDLSGYDLILSSSHAVAKGVMTGPDQIHISYVHSPMRYAWDLQHQYLQASGLNKKLSGYIARYLLHKLRIWDAHAANRVDHFIANSNFVARRIQKAYRREATVIYPPVNIKQITPGTPKEDFYLTASRMVPYKKIDLIVESFRALPDKKLIVIGDGPDFKKIKNKAGKNVEMLGYQSDEILLSYLQRAKAFIFAAEEDFGIVPVEAQACGTPVIAYAKGGALETVQDLATDKPTGVYFYEQTSAAICAAIHQFEASKDKIHVQHCVENAARFSTEVFKSKLKEFVRGQVLS